MVTEINENGVGVLKRLADFENGRIQKQFGSSAPIYKTLYNKNCVLPENFIGIFGWRTDPHLIKKGRDFVTSKCYLDQVPIGIIELKSCGSKNDLRDKLLSGIKLDFFVEKILVSYRVDNSLYRGVLCTEDDFRQADDKKKILAERLPFFEVNKQSFVEIEGRFFYSKLYLSNQIGTFHTKSLPEIIKNKIILRINQTNFKNNFSDSDLQKFREFIRGFSSEDFYQEIAKNYSISSEEAKKYVEIFVHKYDQYLSTEIFSDEVFSSIILHCPLMLEKFKQVVSEKWEKDNAQRIFEANLQLDKLHQKIDSELKNCLDLENEIEGRKNELEEISKQIKQREEFAVEVEKKIAQRIELARKNVADFICEMAFVNPNLDSSSFQNSKNIFYRAGETVEGDEVEIEDFKDFIYTLETELGVEGTQNENILSFATYLTVAYMNKVLLLLAGPNARDIADAFSVTLTGKTAAVFDCANVNSFADLEIISNGDDEIVAALNPFAPNFIAYLPELVNIKGKFIFAIYPFAEDLKIEPRSFYNYFLPVFTELIIDRPPARSFSTKYLIPEKLKQELKQRYNPDKISILSEKRVQKLKRDMREFFQEKKSVELFADFPLAYVRGQEEKFIDNFKGEEKILEKIREFLGESS